MKSFYDKGAFKYYVIKEVGGWVGQMMMFDDKVGDFDDAFKYYYDVILKPFSKFMLKAIEKMQHLDIKVICTGHGPILRKN